MTICNGDNKDINSTTFICVTSEVRGFCPSHADVGMPPRRLNN